ncbi:DMT family transporter [Streptomyces sp. NBC_00663]|uniref:DMT family transporter n=1 Tax=Streptomyces sp. NBC_00663 TaxID=2975801 RepID=UPI002E3182CC|nr:DMT family transporter [Streptomyces sp. NBC_00663]
MSALALSVVLSLVSAVAYAGGAIVQEQVAVSSPEQQFAPLRRPSWWAAVALNGLGGLLHVVALAFGPLSLVQPLGALTIVFALPMAALLVGRRAGATAWRGAIMATVGLAGLLSLVGASDAQSLDTTQRVAVATVTGVAVVALMIAGRAAHRHPAVRSILLATASGIAFGMSSVFTKTVAVDWTGGVSVADVPSLAVIGVLATAGMLLSQASYRGAGLAAPLATLTVVNPVVAAVVGITMFGETFRYGTTGTALALSCGVVAAGGLILLTSERISRTESVPEPETVRVPAQPQPTELEPTRVQDVQVRDIQVPDVQVQDVQVQGVQVDDVHVRVPASAEELLAVLPGQTTPREEALVEEALVTVAESAVREDPADPADPEEQPIFYVGPLYGASYIPMPVLDRHRTRVKS